MSSDITLDLNESSGKKSSKTIKPTLAENLYADRILAGIADMPEILDLGTKTAIEQKTKDSIVVTATDIQNFKNGRDLINQLLGQAQTAATISQLSRTIGISKLAYVKESKAYKGLKGMNPNGAELSGTWEEFCTLLGISVDKADMDIANLKAFGQEALESMSRMGVGYRDLAQYRKLPDDDKLALIEAAKSGDKDQLIDLAESLIEKHIKEKAELNHKNTELEQDLKDSDRRINNMNSEIEQQEYQIKRLSQGKKHITDFLPLTEDIREECMALQYGCELHLNSLQKLFEDTASQDADAPEVKMQLEQIYIAASTATARALEVLNTIRNISPFEDMPDRIHGQHILTPQEAEKWLLDYPMIEGRYQAEKAARETKRDLSKPKGRGRPKGSINKAED